MTSNHLLRNCHCNSEEKMLPLQESSPLCAVRTTEFSQMGSLHVSGLRKRFTEKQTPSMQDFKSTPLNLASEFHGSYTTQRSNSN